MKEADAFSKLNVDCEGTISLIDALDFEELSTFFGMQNEEIGVGFLVSSTSS